MRRFLYALIVVGGLMIYCGDSGQQAADPSLVVIVESSLYDLLHESVEQYAEAMRLEQFEIYVEPWKPGTVQELRQLVFDYIDAHQIEGALLVGDLPAALYEQQAWNRHEVFPTDIYLQDRAAQWVDQDHDEIYDFHTEDLHADIYTARLNGSVTQLRRYFERVQHHRDVGPLVEPSALIFIDDDWARTNTDDSLGLNELYDDVEVIKDEAESTLENYLARLTGDGAEFVYQKIHGGQEILTFEHFGEDGEVLSETLTASRIARENLKVSFVNMTDCFSADFSFKGSVAESFMVGTDYGLAVIGLTKEGILPEPRVFHQNLSRGMSWGQAYRAWFNEVGIKDEKNSLGVVILGDPLLTLSDHPPNRGATDDRVAPEADDFD
jgi:hypothetical protein